jgi:hypothetical protein
VQARARWQQRSDPPIVWLYADPYRPGEVIEKNHCAQRQPHQHFQTIGLSTVRGQADGHRRTGRR